MRVLHVIPGLAAAHGGPSYAVPAMAAALVRQGVQVDVVTTAGPDPGAAAAPLTDPVLADGVRFLFFARQRPRSWSFSLPLSRWIFRHIADYDVLHVHALFAYPTLASCMAARRRGVPYVLRPLGTLDPWGLKFRRWKKIPYFKLIERRNLSGAAAVHATSTLEERGIRALGLPLRVVTIPLGIDMPDRPPEKRRAPSDPGPLNVLFLSRLHPIKGLELLIDAIAEVGSPVAYRLLLAGDGELQYVRGLRELTVRRGVADRVRFGGFVSGDAKQRLLAQADLFVLPSYSESFGVAVAEAMAAGIPVIVSDRVGLATAVEKAGAGLVVPLEVKNLAAALTGLLGDPQRRRDLGAAGRSFVESELTWPSVAARLIRLYEDIARTGRGG